MSTTGAGRQMLSFLKGQTIFAQGDTADAIFVILEGRTRLSARSKNGKEATLDILSNQDFIGEDCIAGERIRTAYAIAMTDCTLLRVEKKVMVRALAREISLSNLLSAYVLGRNMRYQQDLVDQRCNPSEKRLARILLLLAHFDARTVADAVVPNISHETLAEMVGTTRSRVCFFMKRFKVSGFIDYKGSRDPMRICRSLVAFQAT
jgi:CRP-like cAMP-binding protein